MSDDRGSMHAIFLGIKILAAVYACIFITACGGLDVVADDTDIFEAMNYTLYAWRSEPPSQAPDSKDMTTRKSPSIRLGVEEKMSELGYQRVEKESAQFLVEYFATPGLNDGQLLSGGSNETLYGSSVNRQIDGATADNAYALSKPVETGKVELVFLDAQTIQPLWRVQVSIVVENSNRIDHDEVRKAMRKAISKLSPAA